MARLSALCFRYGAVSVPSLVVVLHHKIHLNGAQSSGDDNKHLLKNSSSEKLSEDSNNKIE